MWPGQLVHHVPAQCGPWELSWSPLRVRVCACLCTSTWRTSRPSPLRFFEDLEQRHKAQVCVDDISDILEEHAEKHFHPYVAYCSNEVYQQRALQRLT